MSSQAGQPPAQSARRPARDVIEAVLDNMRQNLEPLKYSTLAPGRYVVYLHPQELARLEGILPVLERETIRALDEELVKLNRRTPATYLKRWLRQPAHVENPAGSWQVDFLPDPDGDLAEGDILVQSDLVLASRDEPGGGQRTRRITTVFSGHRTTRREVMISGTSPSLLPVHARLRWEDNSGAHTFDITSDVVSVGRGGVVCRVDARIDASVDVSREHIRIHRDPATRRYSIVDLSSLGSTLNGRALPKGYELADGTKRENGVATPLPDRARIGLADTIHLDFEIVADR